MDALNEAWNEASQQMYQQATRVGPGSGWAGGRAATGPAADRPEEKKVEDAQYEVIDDKDKDKKK